MQVFLEKRNNIIPKEFIETIDQLEGKYLISIRSLDNKTLDDFRANYFALIDSVRDVTGNSRYTIHEDFKRERKIETTKDFDFQNWINFLEAFRWYYFAKLDLIL
jgi:hypothetical protein